MHSEELQSDQKIQLEMQTDIRFQFFPDRWTDRQQEPTFSGSGYHSLCWPTLELMHSSNALHIVKEKEL